MMIDLWFFLVLLKGDGNDNMIHRISLMWTIQELKYYSSLYLVSEHVKEFVRKW